MWQPEEGRTLYLKSALLTGWHVSFKIAELL